MVANVATVCVFATFADYELSDINVGYCGQINFQNALRRGNKHTGVLWLRAFNQIFMEKVQQHRQIYPLPFEQICKLSSFEQILGRKKSDYTEEERKARWNKAMDIPGGKRVKEYYLNLFECVDWKHFLKLRCDKSAHPQAQELANMLLEKTQIFN